MESLKLLHGLILHLLLVFDFEPKKVSACDLTQGCRTASSGSDAKRRVVKMVRKFREVRTRWGCRSIVQRRILLGSRELYKDGADADPIEVDVFNRRTAVQEWLVSGSMELW